VSRATLIVAAATLLGCVARADARALAPRQTPFAFAYPDGPYGFHAGEVYPPLLTMRSLYDPRGDRGVSAIVLVVSSPTALEATKAIEPLARQVASERGLRHVLALFDHATQQPLDHVALAPYAARVKDVIGATPDDVAPGLVIEPTRFVIDPRTMKIVTVAEGIATSTCDPDAEALLRENGAVPGSCDG
jgi:hypothetical protein